MKSYFDKLLEKYDKLSFIRPSAIPDMELYMDQVTTFMEEHLNQMRRDPEDKILTKTMINNYTKNRLFPPPIRKKYSRNHLITLIYIYYLKSILSISDIATLLKPMTNRYWNISPRKKPNYKSIYQDLLHLEMKMYRFSREDIQTKIRLAENSFASPEIQEKDLEYLQKFAMVSMLGYDVYMKKHLMEVIIDDMKREESAQETPKASREKKK